MLTHFCLLIHNDVPNVAADTDAGGDDVLVVRVGVAKNLQNGSTVSIASSRRPFLSLAHVLSFLLLLQSGSFSLTYVLLSDALVLDRQTVSYR